jgi:hypothetical protein
LTPGHGTRLPENPLTPILHHLRRHFPGAGSHELTDRQLLERFAHHQDETAFAALMHRHGPMVQGVCRRVLARAEDAEDAFQATFTTMRPTEARPSRRWPSRGDFMACPL